MLHHHPRYKSETQIKAIFYNCESVLEEDLNQGKEYIHAMGLNFHSKHNEVLYIHGNDLSEVVF